MELLQNSRHLNSESKCTSLAFINAYESILIDASGYEYMAADLLS